MTSANRPTIAVAMSGGVDSSVAAALLKEEGYSVVGVTMHLWDNRDSSGVLLKGRCCSTEDVYDARRIASILDIPHYVINLQEAFQDTIITTFISKYLSGKTPSPCIDCNFFLKFQFLLNKILQLGAEKLATGHYALLEHQAERNRWILRKGKDAAKDQSYFLFSLNQSQLSKALFPLGGFLKSHVRNLAKKYKLPVAGKADSQQLCFITDDNYRRFIELHHPRIIPTGSYVTADGKFLGKHKGIHHYTIGQRRKLGIAAGKPLYVVKIIPKENKIVLGEEQELHKPGLIAESMNWISQSQPTELFRASARIRYKHEESPATIIPISNRSVKVLFDKHQRAIAPGQALVIYDKDIVIGGGWISEVLETSDS
jgi:tRNA-uridine 2-sulfurtransferase